VFTWPPSYRLVTGNTDKDSVNAALPGGVGEQPVSWLEVSPTAPHPRPAPDRSPGRRPSRRRYALRRVGALAVLVLVGYSLVRVVGGALSGDDGTAGADAPTIDDRDDTVDGTVDGTDAPVVSDGSASESAPATSEATPVPVESSGPASPANPATVFIVGDSDAGTFGPYLQELLDGTQIIETQLDYKVSSGLSRPDFFDWPAEMATKLPEVDPDIVVATFGGNDAQPLSVADGEFIIGDPVANEAEWIEEYQQRAGAMMDQLMEGGRTLVWVGIPNDDNPEVTARMEIQDRAAKAAAAERPDVIFVDTWSRFSGRDGGWAEFVIDPRDGQGKDVRASDGFHLNTTGAEILALDIAQEVRDVLRDQGADI